MFALLAIGFLSTQSPKSFEELEQAKIEAITYLPNFGFQAELKNVGVGVNEKLTVRATHADVSYSSIDQDLRPSGSGKTTGSANWILTTQDRFANSQTVKLGDIPDGYSSLLMPQQLAVSFSAGQQISFGSQPHFVLQSIKAESKPEDGLTLQKAVATASLKRGTATLTQWFLPGTWIVKRFSLEVKDSEGTFSASGVITDMNL